MHEFPENYGCHSVKLARIAIISSSCPPWITGGISSAHYNLYCALKKRGYNVNLFTFTDHGKDIHEENDVVRDGTPKILLAILRYASGIYSYILNRIENSQYAYQIPYIAESAIGSIKASISVKRFKPNVIIVPDNGAPGFFIRKMNGCQTVFISHHNPVRFLNEPLFGIFSEKDAKLASIMEDKTLKKVDKVIVPSRYMKDKFKETRTFSGPVEVIPNLVDNKFIETIPVYDLRKYLGLHGDAPVIYIPSAGSRLKGSRFVFEIIRRLSAVYEQNIGFYLSGDIKDDLLERELDFAPDNAKIFMPGNVSYYENISFVKGCSFCISPTLIESFGMAILEANFCSLPVVTFKVGGNEDIISDGENGFLVPMLDIEKMIFYSVQLFGKTLREVMRTRTLSLVNEKFNADAICERYMNFICRNDLGCATGKGE